MPAGNSLPVLVGEPLTTCPTAAYAQDAEVRMWAELVPSMAGPGALSGMPLAEMPPRYRAMMAVAVGWLEAAREAVKQ